VKLVQNEACLGTRQQNAYHRRVIGKIKHRKSNTTGMLAGTTAQKPLQLKARVGREGGIGLVADVLEIPPTAKQTISAGIATRKPNSFKSMCLQSRRKRPCGNESLLCTTSTMVGSIFRSIFLESQFYLFLAQIACFPPNLYKIA
jgi:hypothetical protein